MYVSAALSLSWLPPSQLSSCGSSSRRGNDAEEPCIFLFRTVLRSVATHLHHFSMVLFSVLCFFFVDVPFEQTRLYRENSLREIIFGEAMWQEPVLCD